MTIAYKLSQIGFCESLWRRHLPSTIGGHADAGSNRVGNAPVACRMMKVLSFKRTRNACSCKPLHAQRAKKLDVAPGVRMHTGSLISANASERRSTSKIQNRHFLQTFWRTHCATQGATLEVHQRAKRLPRFRNHAWPLQWYLVGVRGFEPPASTSRT